MTSKPKLSQWQWVKHPTAKRLFTLCRWLHVYVSSALLGLVLLFAITGFTLNHADWFDSRADSGVLEYPLPVELLNTLQNTPHNQTALLEYLTQSHGLNHPRAVEVDLDAEEITLDYPLPAGYAFVTVLLGDELMELEYQNGTVIAWLNDLHKGRHTGAVWSWIIDGSALLMTLFALTGTVILLQNRKYRSTGSLSVLAGLLAPWLIAVFWIPSFSIPG